MVFAVSATSITVNSGRIAELQANAEAAKHLTFLVSYIVVFYLVVSVVRRFRDIDFILRVLVGAGCIVAAFAMVELYAGANVFNNLDRLVPVLKQTGVTDELARAGRLRVYGSAQHPIALGSVLVLLIPAALYLARTSAQRRWLIAVPVLLLGAFTTVSRTSVLSLVVIGLVYLMLRPRETMRLWPYALAALILVHVALPGTLSAFYKGFFPEKGLIAEEDGTVGSSRVASFGPALDEVGQRPLLGSGYGARIPSGPNANSFIVDDQWLSTTMETGLLGLVAWAWLFTRFIRQMFRAARRDRGDRGWFFTAITASTAGFAIGMVTFDAFSFIQVTFVLFILLALGSAALNMRDERTARVS
jgi:polysaccharide biosynthesis protein PslJ